MRNRFRQIGLVVIGVLVGAAITVNYSAIADKDALAPLPVDELR
jgi:carboxyl-terminal processing protease